jgi:hypothetical protein
MTPKSRLIEITKKVSLHTSLSASNDFALFNQEKNDEGIYCNRLTINCNNEASLRKIIQKFYKTIIHADQT